MAIAISLMPIPHCPSLPPSFYPCTSKSMTRRGSSGFVVLTGKFESLSIQHSIWIGWLCWWDIYCSNKAWSELGSMTDTWSCIELWPRAIVFMARRRSIWAAQLSSHGTLLSLVAVSTERRKAIPYHHGWEGGASWGAAKETPSALASPPLPA